MVRLPFVPCFLICTSFVLLLSSLGCEQRLGDFTFLSSKNMDLTNFSTEGAETTKPVHGEDLKKIVVVYDDGYPSMEEAVDRAIEQGGGKGMALTNAAIYYDFWYIPYIYGEMKYSVKGNLVLRKE